MKAGTVLKNGAIVIEHKGDKVIAINGGAFQPFVIWSIDKNGNCFNGVYCCNFKDAIESYTDKVKV